jgi:hypothetical protein
MECSRPLVARLMRKAGIRARRRRTYKVTTTLSKHNYPVAIKHAEPPILGMSEAGADLTRSGSATLHI